jgi:hypothetical protein
MRTLGPRVSSWENLLLRFPLVQLTFTERMSPRHRLLQIATSVHKMSLSWRTQAGSTTGEIHLTSSSLRRIKLTEHNGLIYGKMNTKNPSTSPYLRTLTATSATMSLQRAGVRIKCCRIGSCGKMKTVRCSCLRAPLGLISRLL